MVHFSPEGLPYTVTEILYTLRKAFYMSWYGWPHPSVTSVGKKPAWLVQGLLSLQGTAGHQTELEAKVRYFLFCLV